MERTLIIFLKVLSFRVICSHDSYKSDFCKRACKTQPIHIQQKWRLFEFQKKPNR